MITVNTDNVVKLSEGVLCERQDALYDQGQIESDEYVLIEAELDRRASLCRLYDLNKKKIEIAKQTELQNRITEYEELRQSLGKRVTMRAMVDEFGHEFIEQYHIDQDFKVHSACFNIRNPNQPNVWQCGSRKEATNKVFYLVYWRVYDRYFREPDNTSIVRLKVACA